MLVAAVVAELEPKSSELALKRRDSAEEAMTLRGDNT
jgi:hypothetical protein